MTDDSDLKRMFDAQRKIDKGRAPSFEDIHSVSSVSRDTSPGRSVNESASLLVAVTVSVIALSVVIAIFTWTNIPQPDVQRALPTTQTDLQKLYQVCDSLLVTISEMDSTTNARPNHETDEEMDWPTETDSLIPFDTLSFNVRTSP